MSTNYNPQIVTDGLILCLDAGNKKSLDFNSLYFDGNGDYVQFADSELFNFGSGDFTVETWIFLNSLPSSGFYWSILSQRTNYSNNYAFTFAISPDSGGSVYFSMSQNGNASQSDIVAGLIPIAAGVWAHVAVSRQSGTTKMFMNGNLVTTNTATNVTIFNSSATVKCGAFDEPAWSNSFLNGHIKDLRVTKGVARYTNNFTPIQRIEHSTDPYKANVSLLLNPGTSSVAKDYSDNNLTPTVFGNTSISSPWKNIISNDYATFTGTGSPTFNTGNLGNLVFTAQTQYAEFADIPTRINSPNFSIESVFYFNNIDSLAVFKNKRNPNWPYKQFGMFMSDSSIIYGGSGKHLCLLLIPDNSPDVFSRMRSLSYDLSLGGGARIIHAVGVNDSTSARLYVNGQLVASNATAQPSATYNIPGYNSYCQGPTTLYLSKLYNITLTQQQISQNFNAIRGRFNI